MTSSNCCQLSAARSQSALAVEPTRPDHHVDEGGKSDRRKSGNPGEDHE
jgi:hypothetical protein